MERRLVLFLVLSFAILLSYFALLQKFGPHRPPPPGHQAVASHAGGAEKAKKPQTAKPATAEKAHEKPAAGPAKTASAGGPAKAKSGKSEAAKHKELPPTKPPAQPALAQQWITLGSADPKDPYRMLVTLTNQGAAVDRIELNSPSYCDIDDRSGYLGNLIMDTGVHRGGCPVQVVGPGTPAAKAGLRAGDLLKAVNGQPVVSGRELQAILEATRPNQTVSLSFSRGGQETTAQATLRRRPLDMIRPENDDPLSMLLTLQQFDDQKIGSEEAGKESDLEVGQELKGVDLRTANWKVVAADQEHAQFRRLLADKGLEILKTYRLVKVPAASQADSNFPAYNLEFQIEIRNTGRRAHQVAYRLDGPNGLPDEGKWYALKVSRSWGGAGLRDFIVSFGGAPEEISATTIAADKKLPKPRAEYPGQLVKFIGIDSQYFSGVLMPERSDPNEIWFEQLRPLRVGEVDKNHPNWANTSCQLVSVAGELKPGGALVHKFKLFVGPKKPGILTPYGLNSLVYYGWFEWIAVPLVSILHFFYGVFHNFGIAIILLTILVRGCMFPFSRKQALGALKMQQLQPEIKRIQEQYKKDLEARSRAQQELFRKHNYNPLGGCLTPFIQIPVFIGLYNALKVDVALRDAPLLTYAIRWCSNLAAPDMLFNWSGFMPGFVVKGPGIFWLGPYFNLLPILTVFLFIAQQKMFMPPAADEQAAVQQKIMKYMMIFMGILFYKVASGLCLYFIASSLWGLGERQFLPKPKPVQGGTSGETRAQAKARARQAAQAAQAKAKKK